MYREQAVQILKRVRSGFASEHKYRMVHADDFRHLSLAFYRESQRILESLGFRCVGDVEDETVKRQGPDPRTFIRIMSAKDGVVVAAMYHIRPTFIWRICMFLWGMRATKIVELQTELENRYQVTTTTVPSRDLLPSSPKLFRNFLPHGTPIPELYRSHLEIIERVERDANVRPVANRTLGDILGFENRQMAIQREYLESVGWVTEDYLRKRAGGNAEIAKAISDEIKTILKEEKEGTPGRRTAM